MTLSPQPSGPKIANGEVPRAMVNMPLPALWMIEKGACQPTSAGTADKSTSLAHDLLFAAGISSRPAVVALPQVAQAFA
jgi:hypothetical protein